MIRRETMVVGPFQCNCSILIDDVAREAIVIDPGDEWDRIEAVLARNKVRLKLSVHTHAHLDHIGAVTGLKGSCPDASIVLHKADEDLYKNLPMQGKLFGIEYEAPPPVDRFVQDAETIEFGGVSCSVIHTPGHSPGGICLRFAEGLLAETPVLFTGDTLFQASVGRTDLWGGDYNQLVKTIRQRLYTLEEETLVLPGHGPKTTIASESRDNPFVTK